MSIVHSNRQKQQAQSYTAEPTWYETCNTTEAQLNMISSTVVSFKNWNASNHSAWLKCVLIIYKHIRAFPPTIIETKIYNEKTAGDKESRLLLFEVILWWSGFERTISSRREIYSEHWKQGGSLMTAITYSYI